MRLIDADALMRSIEPIKEAEEQIYRRESWGFAIKCRNAIDDAPTIEPDWNEMLVICDNCGHAIRVKREAGENR